MRLRLTAGGRTRVFGVLRRGDRLLVTFDDGREVALRLLSDGGGRFELERGHQRIHGAGAVQGLSRQLWVNGRTLTYSCDLARAGPDEPGEASLASPLPAVVLEVLVKAGDAVKAGQRLVLLESMKTVLPIQAQRDGIVGAVMCAPGEAVAAGVPLVELR